jgi:hypothetical protein
LFFCFIGFFILFSFHFFTQNTGKKRKIYFSLYFNTSFPFLKKSIGEIAFLNSILVKKFKFEKVDKNFRNFLLLKL